MKNKLFCFLGIIAIFTKFSAQADSINYGLIISPGVSFEGGKTKTPQTEVGLEPSVNASGALFFGIDFGQTGEEIIGFYLFGGFDARKFLNEKENNKVNDNDNDKVQGLHILGVPFGLGVKLMFTHFNSGCLYTKLGLDALYAVKKMMVGVPLLSSEVEKEQERLDARIADWNVSIKAEFGVQFWDQVLFSGIGIRYFLLEQIVFSEQEKEQMKKDKIEMSLGKGQIDLNIFLGVNFGKIGSGGPKDRSDNSSTRRGKNASRESSAKTNPSRSSKR